MVDSKQNQFLRLEVQAQLQTSNTKSIIEDIQPLQVTNQNNELSKAKPTQSYFQYGVKLVPHIEKRHRGGEDAYYVDDQMLVVLDGVGGWNDAGVNPGLFSRQLAYYIAQEHKQNPEKTLKMCLVDAVQKTTVKGSSTATLVRLDHTDSQHSGVGILKTTNLGDSGYVIFRIETPKTSEDLQPMITKQFRSKQQQYRFNFPYQCGTNCDLPYDAFDTEHVLQDQDLVIVGSDGLFDNVYDEDMIACITPQLKVGKKKIDNLFKVADCLANKAESHGHDRIYFSPFAKGAKDSGLINMGGKLDDVTVVVAQFQYVPSFQSASTPSEQQVEQQKSDIWTKIKNGDSDEEKKQMMPPPGDSQNLKLVLTQLLKYLEIKDILLKMIHLNKQSKQLVHSQNYIMFKHFLNYMNLGEKLKKSTIPAHTNVLQLIKENISQKYAAVSQNLNPCVFYTDGGTYNSDLSHFINNIFSRQNICHSTKVPKNVNIQAYIGQLVNFSPSKIQLKNCYVKSSNHDEIKLPYLQNLNENDEESYKIITSLQIHNIDYGYTCFASAYMLFITDKELNASKKSEILAYFSDINTIQKFEELGLPIANVTDSADGTINKAYEIDISDKGKIKKIMKINKLDCYPVLFVYSSPSQKQYQVEFKQMFASKFVVLKLIDSHNKSLSDDFIKQGNKEIMRQQLFDTIKNSTENVRDSADFLKKMNKTIDKYQIVKLQMVQYKQQIYFNQLIWFLKRIHHELESR